MSGFRGENEHGLIPQDEALKASEWNFNAFTARVGEIYGEHNKDVDYQPDTMFAKLIGNVVTLKKSASKNPPQLTDVSDALTRTLAWLSSIAGDAGISLDEVLEEKFGKGDAQGVTVSRAISRKEELAERPMHHFRNNLQRPRVLTGGEIILPAYTLIITKALIQPTHFKT